MSKGVVFINNKFVPLQKAAVPVTDLAVQRGYGASEVFRTYHRIPFELDSHLRRLERSLKLLHLPLSVSRSKLEQIIAQGTRRLPHGEVLVKILVTGGPGDHIMPLGRPSLIVIFTPNHMSPLALYRRGLALKTFFFHPYMPFAKTVNYLHAILAQVDARKAGYDEALFHGPHGGITEGTTYNFALIKRARVITPRAGVLKGITMDVALRVAKTLGFKVVRRQLSERDLRSCDEAFTTSTMREVMPVVRVDKILIGRGKPGKYAKLLLEAFRNYAGNKNKQISKRVSLGRGDGGLSGRRRHRK